MQFNSSQNNDLLARNQAIQDMENSGQTIFPNLPNERFEKNTAIYGSEKFLQKKYSAITYKL